MKRYKLLMMMLAFGGLVMTGCNDEDSAAPSITGTVFLADNEAGTSSTEIYITPGTDVGYKFVVNTAAPIKRLELWGREGLGKGGQAPIRLFLLTFSEAANSVLTYQLTDTVANISTDWQFSVYAEDFNSNFSSTKINAFLDVTRYNQELTDGASTSNTATFLNLDSGRNYYIANTIGDPTGIDLGFTYLENTNYGACLVSFDEYYKTGNYAMVVNDLNPSVSFKVSGLTADDLDDLIAAEITREKAVLTAALDKQLADGEIDQIKHDTDLEAGFEAIETNTGFLQAVRTIDQLKQYYDGGSQFGTYPALPAVGFTAGKVAWGLEENDLISFQTGDGRYGLMQVTSLDTKNESVANNQIIGFDVVIVKKRY